jgi:hypothetical protein
VVEDTELMATVDLPLHRQSQSMKLRTRPSRLPQKITRLAHPSPVAHHLHSRRATTHTMDMVHTTDVAVAVVAAEDVEVLGVVAANSDHPPVFPPSCKT